MLVYQRVPYKLADKASDSSFFGRFVYGKMWWKITAIEMATWHDGTAQAVRSRGKSTHRKRRKAAVWNHRTGFFKDGVFVLLGSQEGGKNIADISIL